MSEGRGLIASLEEQRSWWWKSERGERQKRPNIEQCSTLYSLLFYIKLHLIDSTVAASQCVGLGQAQNHVQGQAQTWHPPTEVADGEAAGWRGSRDHPQGMRRGGKRSRRCCKMQILLLVGSQVTALPLIFRCQQIRMAEEVSGQDGALFEMSWFCGLEFFGIWSLPARWMVLSMTVICRASCFTLLYLVELP